jgi:hypothetical protein
VNLPVAACPPGSVAITFVPDVPLGTANVQLNEPVAPVVKEPLVQLEMLTPSKTNSTVIDTEKPVPDTIVDEPTGPLAGLTVIFSFVTVNLPVAACPPASVAVTFVPDVPLGTANVQLNDPVAPVVTEPPAQFEIVSPSKTSPTGLCTEKPVPDAVTVAPTGPWVGLTVTLSFVAVNLPVAVCPPTSIAVTFIPDVPLGTANVQLNEPAAPVVTEPLAQLEVITPSKTSPTVLDTEKPVPSTVTVAPMGPWVGLTAIFSFVTVNLSVAVFPPMSVAVTFVPDVPLGTANLQLNEPDAPVVKEPPVQLEIITSSRTSPTGLDTEKPVPDTVTVAPIGPSKGLAAIFGLVIVNVWGGVRVPVAVSSPTTEYGPAVSLGTVNEQTNAPDPSVVMAVSANVPSEQAVGVSSTELNETVAPDDALKPDPDAV